MRLKKFKIFENSNEPQIGDYAYAFDLVSHENNFLHNFLHNNIGRIVDIKISEGNEWRDYVIEYENVPEDIILHNFEYISSGYKNRRRFFIDDIKYFSPNKEEVEIQKEVDKYNL